MRKQYNKPETFFVELITQCEVCCSCGPFCSCDDEEDEDDIDEGVDIGGGSSDIYAYRRPIWED